MEKERRARASNGQDRSPRRGRPWADRRAPPSQRGHQVTVIEREPLPGGLAAGFEIEPGIWLEKFYHHLFRSDQRAVAMIEELGLGERLEWSAPVTATLRDGRLHQLDSPKSLLGSRPCRWPIVSVWARPWLP